VDAAESRAPREPGAGSDRPEMLEAVRNACARAHPYSVTPDHTRQASRGFGARSARLRPSRPSADRGSTAGESHRNRWLRADLELPNTPTECCAPAHSPQRTCRRVSDRCSTRSRVGRRRRQSCRRVNEHRAAGATTACSTSLTPIRRNPRSSRRLAGSGVARSSPTCRANALIRHVAAQSVCRFTSVGSVCSD